MHAPLYRDVISCSKILQIGLKGVPYSGQKFNYDFLPIIKSHWHFVLMSLRHSCWMYLTLIGQQNINGTALESWRFMDYELICQYINYQDILYHF